MIASLSANLSFLCWIAASITCYRARMTVVIIIIDLVDLKVNLMLRMKNMNRSLSFANVTSASVLTEACKDGVDPTELSRL